MISPMEGSSVRYWAYWGRAVWDVATQGSLSIRAIARAARPSGPGVAA